MHECEDGGEIQPITERKSLLGSNGNSQSLQPVKNQYNKLNTGKHEKRSGASISTSMRNRDENLNSGKDFLNDFNIQNNKYVPDKSVPLNAQNADNSVSCKSL